MDPRANVDRYGKSRPTGIRSLDCPSCSESLCFPDLLAIASVLFELVLCDSALEILSLILSGVMAVLQVFKFSTFIQTISHGIVESQTTNCCTSLIVIM